MSNFMPFVPSDLSANAQPPENAVNEQTDRWADRQTNNNIHKHPWMLSVSHLDTSACQIVGHFIQALCMQYTNPSPWMVGRTDERMKWQYPSASMLAKGKSSGNICISNSIARPPHQPPVILSGTPELGLTPLTCVCWQINSILANIGHRNSIRILNQYPFWWNILIWA